MQTNNSTTEATKDATVRFAETGRDYLNRLTGDFTENTQKWTAASQRLIPALGRDVTAPRPKELIDASFDIAQQVLTMQRELAHKVVDRFGAILTDKNDTKPASPLVAPKA